jgi:hypothetical protein
MSDNVAELARKLAQMKAELDREVRLLRAASMGASYDHWKTTNPEDKEYCRCGVHASDCMMDQFGDCPVEDQEMEEESMAEASPTMNHLIDNARRHVVDVRMRMKDLPTVFDLTKIRVALDTLDADLNAMARQLSNMRNRP